MRIAIFSRGYRLGTGKTKRRTRKTSSKPNLLQLRTPTPHISKPRPLRRPTSRLDAAIPQITTFNPQKRRFVCKSWRHIQQRVRVSRLAAAPIRNLRKAQRYPISACGRESIRAIEGVLSIAQPKISSIVRSRLRLGVKSSIRPGFSTPAGIAPKAHC